jgi:DNA-binding transcriptional ArsR family regulator
MDMLDLVLHALAQSHRREILLLLRGTERSSGDIAAHFELTRPAISQHLQVLVAADLVAVRRHGTQRLYRAHSEGFGDLRSFLEGFWDEHLQRLKREAEAEERRAKGYDRTGPGDS